MYWWGIAWAAGQAARFMPGRHGRIELGPSHRRHFSPPEGIAL